MKTLVLNFENLANGKAIKAMQKAFARVGTFVVTAEADPKVKTSAGVKYKTLNLSFNDGQKMSLDAKSTGDVFQVRVNGKVMPIKNHENIDKAIVEIVNVLDKGRAKFQAKMTRVKVELPKGLKSTAKKQHELLKETVSELDMQIEEATQRRDELKAEMGLDSVALDGLSLSSDEKKLVDYYKSINRKGSELSYNWHDLDDIFGKNSIESVYPLNRALVKKGILKEKSTTDGGQQLFLTEKAFDAVHPAKVKVGDNVHHPKENRTGMVRRITGKGLEVRTTRGLENWDFDDVELVPDDEAFDGVALDGVINGTKSTEILLSQFKKRSHSDYDIEQLSEFVDVLKKGDVKKSYQAMNELDTAIREQLPDSLLQFFANQGFKMIGRIPRGGAFDYTGQPRDTNGQYAEGKQGSLKARANKIRFAVKKAFKNPFRD